MKRKGIYRTVKKVAVVVFSFYPADPRVRREAEALMQEKMSVDVICLKGDDETRNERINGVSVYRLSLRRARSGKLRYIFEYSTFIISSFVKLTMLHLKEHYDIIHVHNMPDILIITSLIPKITGSKIVLDLHDPMPEVYMTKYTIGLSHPVIWFLILLEKWSIRFADLVLTPNLAFRNLFISRGCPEEKIHVVMNSPQDTIFSKDDVMINHKNILQKENFVVMYHGTIVKRHGIDTALEALDRIRNKIPNLLFKVYGTGDFVDKFKSLIEKLDMQNIVKYYGHVSLNTIAEAIRTIDVGIIPNKRSPFTELNMPTRIFEYLCMEKPVIAPRTRGIKDYFNEESLYFFDPGNTENLAKVILEAYSNSAKKQKILEKGMSIHKRHCWEVEKNYFINCIKSLKNF